MVVNIIAYEDLTPGRTIDLGEVKADREEMLAFNRRFDPQPYHLDDDAGARTILGGLCASGWFTAALWMRAYVDHVLAKSTAQGSPGGRALSWLAPVYPDDVLRCGIQINSARRSRSRPKLGVVDITGTAHRAGECVLRFDFTVLFGTRS